MMISYNPETGFSWAVTLSGVPAVKPFFDQYGDEGIAYAILFGHPLSPYEYEQDLTERESMVLAEIKERYSQPKKKNKFPERLYETEICSKAIVGINRVSCSPNIFRLHRSRNRELFYEDQLSNVALSENNDERGKQLEADQKCFKLIETIRKEIRVEETFIQKSLSSAGSLSLDMML